MVGLLFSLCSLLTFSLLTFSLSTLSLLTFSLLTFDADSDCCLIRDGRAVRFLKFGTRLGHLRVVGLLFVSIHSRK